MPKALKRVTDSFSLYKTVRKGTQNKRNYLLSAVKEMINSPETQEGLELGELYGYYGHGRREMTGLSVPETSAILVDGKPVIIDNVPSNRTVSISVDDNGVVTHTQEILNTDTGRIVASMIDSHAGGWSWATGGIDSKEVSIPQIFKGFDFVKVPNFISREHPAALMTESVNEDQMQSMMESLSKQGFSDQAAKEIISHHQIMMNKELTIDAIHRAGQAETNVFIMRGELLEAKEIIEEKTKLLESLQQRNSSINENMTQRHKMMLEALKKLPIFVNEEQVKALLEIRTKEDIEIVSSLFESIRSNDLKSLPVHNSGYKKTIPSNNSPSNNNFIVSFSDSETPKFK